MAYIDWTNGNVAGMPVTTNNAQAWNATASRLIGQVGAKIVDADDVVDAKAAIDEVSEMQDI